MKHFTEKDVTPHGAIPNAGRLNLDDYPGDLVDAPLPWQKRGLQQTASGYGARLTSRYKISFCGKLRRIYHTCYGNASSAWIKVCGKTIYIH